MGLDFGVGELAARVRRALSVRGRMPLDLDERLSINVQSIDVGISPWRQDGFGWTLSRTLAAGGAGNAGEFDVAINGGSAPTPLITTRAVVRQLILSNPTAAALGYAWIIQPSVTIFGGAQGFAYEKNTPVAAANVLASIFFGTQLAAGGLLFTADSAAGSAIVPPNSSLVVPVDLTVMAGFPLRIQAQTTNVAAQVSAQGEIWNGDGFALS